MPRTKLLPRGLKGPSGHDRRQRVPAPHRRGRRPPGALPVHVPLGEPIEDLVERDPTLHAGERSAQAVVGAVTKREVRTDLATDVEVVGVVEPALVTVGRGDHQEHGAPGRNGLAVVLDLLGDVTGDMWARRLEPQELLDGVGHEGAVVDQLAALVRVLGKDLAHPAE